MGPSNIDEGKSEGIGEGGVTSHHHQSYVGNTTFAQDLFNGIANSYDTWAQLLTFFQYLSWRKFLVSQMTLQPDHTVLDVATGTAGVALEIASRQNSQIIGVDITRLMLEAGLQAIEKQNLDSRIQLVQGSAEKLPFPDETFDVVVSTYLLRYVRDPGTTIGELSRVLRPGGQLLSLEFGVPSSRYIRALWLFYTRSILPILTILAPGGWNRAGRFLGPSISHFCQGYPVNKLAAMWGEHRFPAVEIKHLLGGTAVVMWGKKR